MRTHILAGVTAFVVLAGAVGPAHSASPQFNWSGFYVGGHGGAAWSRFNWENITDNANFAFTGATVQQQARGFIGGAHIGFQQQQGMFVFGIEGSWSGTSLHVSEFDVDIPASGAGDRYESRIGDIATVTARLGLTANNVLAYVRGGYANARLHIVATDVAAGGITFNSSLRHHGWTVGVGVEFLILANLIAGIEYDYYRLASALHAGLASNGVPFSTPVRADVHSVMARVSLKLP